ncbi:hypothetical protein PCE1_002373 [Barthelona sp. PCE]
MPKPPRVYRGANCSYFCEGDRLFVSHNCESSNKNEVCLLLGNGSITSNDILHKSVIDDIYWSWKEVERDVFDLRTYQFVLNDDSDIFKGEFELIESEHIKASSFYDSNLILINERYSILCDYRNEPYIVNTELTTRFPLEFYPFGPEEHSFILDNCFNMNGTLYYTEDLTIKYALFVSEDEYECPIFTVKHPLVEKEIIAYDVTPGKHRFVTLDNNDYVYYNPDGSYEPVHVKLPEKLPSTMFIIIGRLVFFYIDNSLHYYDEEREIILKDVSAYKMDQFLDINQQLFIFKDGSYSLLLDNIRQREITSFSIAKNQIWNSSYYILPYFFNERKVIFDPFSEQFLMVRNGSIIDMQPFYFDDVWMLKYVKKNINGDIEAYINFERVFEEITLKDTIQTSFNYENIGQMSHSSYSINEVSADGFFENINVFENQFWLSGYRSLELYEIDNDVMIIEKHNVVLPGVSYKCIVNQYQTNQFIFKGSKSHLLGVDDIVHYAEIQDEDVKSIQLQLIRCISVIFIDISVFVIDDTVYIMDNMNTRTISLPKCSEENYFYSPRPGVYGRFFHKTNEYIMKSELFIFNNDYTDYDIHIKQFDIKYILDNKMIRII